MRIVRCESTIRPNELTDWTSPHRFFLLFLLRRISEQDRGGCLRLILLSTPESRFLRQFNQRTDGVMKIFPRRFRLCCRCSLTTLIMVTGLISLSFQQPAQSEDWQSGRSSLKSSRASRRGKPFVVLGYNDLGMHCMNQDFSTLAILPPFNNLHAQVIDRRDEDPKIVTSGISVRYSIPGNTMSANKTNFWNFAPQLFGVALPPNVGLTGNRMKGVMRPTGNGDWSATGIPITPLDDTMSLNPYPLARIAVVRKRKRVAITNTVVPVSWEISCNLCHGEADGNVDLDILADHDRAHGTQLQLSTPVLCAKCHADPALGTVGVPGVSNLSSAMHRSHAPHMRKVQNLGNTCYACHPGFQTNCQRDVHLAKGIQCIACHGDMNVVGDSGRTPWVSEPTCASCHQKRRPNFQFEEPGKLFKDSRGHHGVHCAACHGSPHAITPTVTAADNVQAIKLQGFPGVIRKCTVCHRKRPDEPFEHRLDDDDWGSEDEEDEEEEEEDEDEEEETNPWTEKGE